MTKCVVCHERPMDGVLLCTQCSKAYDRRAHGDGSIAAAIEWAAKRARRFEAKRRRIQIEAVRYR